MPFGFPKGNYYISQNSSNSGKRAMIKPRPEMGVGKGE
jgi:hypothetical protein